MTDSPTRRLKVFLCHSSGDKPVVRELYRQLDAEGWIDVWLDEMKLLPGQEWDIEIEKAVEQADIVVVSLSTHSVDKEGYVQKELRFVLNIADEKPEGSIFVIPVRLDDCLVPRRLRHWQWVDYFPDSQKSFAYTRLLESFKARAMRLGIPWEDQKREPPLNPVEEVVTEMPLRNEPFQDPLLVRRSSRKRKLPQPFVEQIAKYEAERLSQKKTRLWRLIAEIVGVLLLLILLIWGGASLWRNLTNTYPKAMATLPLGVVIPNTPSPSETAILSTPTLGIGSTMIGKDGMTLLYIPAGEFTMGRYAEDAFAECQKLSLNCKLSDYVDEEPPHKVLLDSYWMDQTEVTNDMFAKFLNERGNQIEEGVNWLNTDDLNTHIYQAGNVWEVDKGYEKHPVIDITWYGANSYCSWVDRRLPTEAEWEKAARGEDGRTYPWENEFDCKLANFDDETTLDMNVVYGGKNCDGFPRSSPVGSFIHGVSPYGILDMAGNVWEWVSSLYKPYPYSSIDGREDISSKEARVLRGGSWVNYDDGLRSSDRYAVFHRNSSYIYGFRCAARAIP